MAVFAMGPFPGGGDGGGFAQSGNVSLEVERMQTKSVSVPSDAKLAFILYGKSLQSIASGTFLAPKESRNIEDGITLTWEDTGKITIRNSYANFDYEFDVSYVS